MIELTQRENEILDYIKMGMSTKDIAEFLKRSKKTIDNIRAKIIKKSKAKNTYEALTICIHEGVTIVNNTGRKCKGD